MKEVINMTEKLTSFIIRPARAQYSIKDLGPKEFTYNDKIYERIDFNVSVKKYTPSNTNHQIKASFYHQKYSITDNPTIIYLHGNSSCRLSAKNYEKIALINGFNYVSFDFRGCGMSDGAYITLGYLQKQDLYCLIENIKYKFGCKDIILWGRSMGAVTSILFAQKYQNIVTAIVADSPFGDLQKVMNDLAQKKASMVPGFLVDKIVKVIEQKAQQKIQKQYGSSIKYKVTKLKPIQSIAKVSCPIFFVGSKSDQLVNSTQIKQYYDRANVYKEMEFLQGTQLNET